MANSCPAEHFSVDRFDVVDQTKGFTLADYVGHVRREVSDGFRLQELFDVAAIRCGILKELEHPSSLSCLKIGFVDGSVAVVQPIYVGH